MITRFYRFSGNVAGQYKRAAAVALHIGIGNIGGIIASNIYRTEDSPRYILGRKSLSAQPQPPLTASVDGIELGLIGMGLVAVPTIVFTYNRINTQREAIMREARERGLLQYTDEELRRMGDKAPNFRYSV